MLTIGGMRKGRAEARPWNGKAPVSWPGQRLAEGLVLVQTWNGPELEKFPSGGTAKRKIRPRSGARLAIVNSLLRQQPLSRRPLGVLILRLWSGDLLVCIAPRSASSGDSGCKGDSPALCFCFFEASLVISSVPVRYLADRKKGAPATRTGAGSSKMLQ